MGSNGSSDEAGGSVADGKLKRAHPPENLNPKKLKWTSSTPEPQTFHPRPQTLNPKPEISPSPKPYPHTPYIYIYVYSTHRLGSASSRATSSLPLLRSTPRNAAASSAVHRPTWPRGRLAAGEAGVAAPSAAPPSAPPSAPASLPMLALFRFLPAAGTGAAALTAPPAPARGVVGALPVPAPAAAFLAPADDSRRCSCCCCLRKGRGSSLPAIRCPGCMPAKLLRDVSITGAPAPAPTSTSISSCAPRTPSSPGAPISRWPSAPPTPCCPPFPCGCPPLAPPLTGPSLTVLSVLIDLDGFRAGVLGLAAAAAAAVAAVMGLSPRLTGAAAGGAALRAGGAQEAAAEETRSRHASTSRLGVDGGGEQRGAGDGLDWIACIRPQQAEEGTVFGVARRWRRPHMPQMLHASNAAKTS